MRGPRRFSLATPGLQSVNRAEAAAEVPEAPKAPQTPWSANESVAPRRTLNRGSSLIRRGRPTLIPLEETTTVASARGTFRVTDDAPRPSASRQDTGRAGLQLRRPRTRTTTTTTTEAPAPVEEAIPEVKEEVLPKKELKAKEEKVEKKPVAEEKKAVEEPEAAAEPEPEPEPEAEDNQKEATVEAATEAPKPKLRPIPIKLGGRSQGAAAPRAQKAPEEEAAPEAAAPVQRHRFSADAAPSLRAKTRGREAAAGASAAEAPAAAPPSTPRVRRPLPQQKQTPRISSRTAAAEEPIAAEELTETESRSADFGRRSRG